MSLITANWSKSLWTQVAFIPCWAIWVTSDILWRIPVFGSSGNDIWWQYHYSCIEWKLVSSCFLRIHSCRVDAFSATHSKNVPPSDLQATSKRPPSDDDTLNPGFYVALFDRMMDKVLDNTLICEIAQGVENTQKGIGLVRHLWTLVSVHGNGWSTSRLYSLT